MIKCKKCGSTNVKIDFNSVCTSIPLKSLDSGLDGARLLSAAFAENIEAERFGLLSLGDSFGFSHCRHHARFDAKPSGYFFGGGHHDGFHFGLRLAILSR